MQNLQNNKEEIQAEATGLVQQLHAKITTLKEQDRYMQRQQPEPKKKAKQVALNVGKQK